MAGWRITLWVVLVLATLGFLYAVRGILLPFVLAIVISIVLDPSIRKLRMRGMSRPKAVLLVLSSFFLVVIAIGVWLTPMVAGQLGTFRNTVQNFAREVSTPNPDLNFFVSWNPVVVSQGPREDLIDKALRDFSPTLKQLGLPTTRKAIYDRYIAPNSKQISAGLQGFFNSFFGMIGSITSQLVLLILTPLLVWLILSDMEKIKKRSVTWIPPSIRASTVGLLNEIGAVFTGYMRGMTMAVLIYMGCAAVILLILGVPYSILLGMVFGLVYLIPYIRVFIWAPILFGIIFFAGKSNWLFVSFPSPIYYAGIACVIFFAFDAGFDTFVSPRVIGKAVGLSPAVSVFVSLAGAALFGIPGMLLAYPTAGAVKVILDRLLRFTSMPTERALLPAVPVRHRT